MDQCKAVCLGRRFGTSKRSNNGARAGIRLSLVAQLSLIRRHDDPESEVINVPNALGERII